MALEFLKDKSGNLDVLTVQGERWKRIVIVADENDLVTVNFADPDMNPNRIIIEVVPDGKRAQNAGK